MTEKDVPEESPKLNDSHLDALRRIRDLDLDGLRRHAEQLAREGGVATVIVAVGVGEPSEYVITPDACARFGDPIIGALMDALRQRTELSDMTTAAGGGS